MRGRRYLRCVPQKPAAVHRYVYPPLSITLFCDRIWLAWRRAPVHSSQLRTPHMGVLQIVVENVRRHRREKGLSQAEMANRIGVDRAYISGLELGQRNPTVITPWHAAQALEVEVHLLLKEDD